jgi:ribosomal protein S18 acetylase RimI-like enzyme
VSLTFRPMTIGDYEDAVALWQDAEGVGLTVGDERPAIERCLARNPGMSLVAREGGLLAGAVLCGHDGRRGYIHHLAVADAFRGRGIAREMVARCVACLAEAGIPRCHILVYTLNTQGQGFWRAIGWTLRTDLTVMSRFTRPEG